MFDAVLMNPPFAQGADIEHITRALKMLKPGGRLVYCVCSLEPEEGEAQTPGFLARNPEFALAPMTPGEGGAPEASLRSDGTLRILPHHLVGGTDGFFVARYIRQV